MGLHRDIESMNEAARDKARAFIAALNAAGIKYYVLETVRTLLVQKAYYAQGRAPLEKINALRREAGLWEIGPEEAKRVITWTLQSRHLSGMAIDIAPLNDLGRIAWNAPPEVWEKIGVIGESCGFSWGGRWAEKDYPHFEVVE